MMKKLVGNVVSMLMEALMWITLIACVIGGAVFGYNQAGVGGAIGGLVAGALAGMLLNTMWWFISVILEIRNYSKKWAGKYKANPESSIPEQDSSSPTSMRLPDFQCILAGYGKQVIISLVSLALLAGIIVLAKNFTSSNAEDKKTEKIEEAEEPIESFGFKTVRMPDGKIWMAENLNDASKGGKCYENNPSNCQKYGRLYTWEEAKNACPKDWHLPSDAEWTDLTDFAGGAKVAGKKLKANGTDDYDFSALLGGGRLPDGIFDGIGNYGVWWSSTEYSSSNAYRRHIYNNNNNVYRTDLNKSFSFSVRCVKN